MLWFRKKSPKTREQMTALLRRRLGAADAARLAPWVLPAIGFHDGELGPEPAEVGTTRFGGRPDLPDALPWPAGPNGPLAFLGQVSLADVVPLDLDRVLPASGALLF